MRKVNVDAQSVSTMWLVSGSIEQRHGDQGGPVLGAWISSGNVFKSADLFIEQTVFEGLFDVMGKC